MAVQWDADNGFNGIAVDIFDAIKDKILGVENELPQMTDEVKKALSMLEDPDVLKYDLHDLFGDMDGLDDYFMSFLDEVDLSGDVFQQYQEHLQQSADGMSLFGRTTKFVGSALKSLGATLGSMVVMWAIGEVISIATTAIDNYANRVKYAKEALDDFNSSTKEQQDDLSSQKTWIDENGKQYEQLAEGVDKYGHNISLTSDEFTEYKNLTKEIAETFPSMVSGYNDQNEAIIKNKGSIEALTKAYEDNQKAYYNDILSKSGDTFNDFKTVSKDELSKKNQLSDLMNNKYSQEQMTGLLENYSSFESVFGKTLGKSLTKELFSALNDEFRHEANSYNTTRSSGYNVTSSRTSGYTAGTASRTSGYNTSRSSQYNVTASRTSGYTVGTASRSSGYNTTRSSQYDVTASRTSGYTVRTASRSSDYSTTRSSSYNVTSSRTSGYTVGTASRSSDYSTTRSSGYTANTASRASEYNTSRSSQYNITSSRTSGYTVSTASRSSGYSTTRSSQYDVTATRSSGYVANTSSRTSGYNTTRSSSYNITATRSSQYNLTSNYTVTETASTTHVTRTSYWTSNNFNM